MGFFLASLGSDGTIYIGSDDYNLYAINSDGTKKWSFLTGDSVHSSPILGEDGTIYVGSNDHKLYAINPNGIQIWAFITEGGISDSPAIGSDGTIYVGSGDNKFYAINPDGTQKWALLTKNGMASSPTISSDGTIYVGSYYGFFSGFGSGLFAINSESNGLADSFWPMFHWNTKHTGRVAFEDTDDDGLFDRIEIVNNTNPNDADSDDDGILDGTEDSNRNGMVDPGETDPRNKDSDNDGIQDGTESGVIVADVGIGTDLGVFIPDADPSTTTDPTIIDSDGDGINDGVEDPNFNGAVDPGETSSNLSLNVGWNLISLPKQPTNTDIDSVLSSIVDKYKSVWAYINGLWKSFDPEQPYFSDLTDMQAGIGYWIKMKEARELTVSGTDPSANINLSDGWNLVGFNGSEVAEVETVLASIAGKYISVWAYINGQWKSYDPNQPFFSDLNNVTPGVGYWIKTSEAGTWSLP